MRAQPVRRMPRPWLLLVAVLVTALAGCSALSGSSGAGAGGPEKPHLRLGVLPIVDVAHLQHAQAAGYFAAEGLSVDLVTVQGGAAALPRLLAGDLDLTFTNYVSVLLEQSQGHGDFRFVDGGYEAAEDTLMIMVAPGSDIRTPRDLAGKRIAVNTARNIIELTARSALETAGVAPDSVRFVEIPFPDMAKAVQSHQVDAAFMVEPFITQAALSFGAISVLDAASGPTAGIPLGGVVLTADFAARYPKTVAAFRRAVARGQADMADRSVVEKTLPTYTKITPDTAALIALGSWPVTLDRVRLQRDIDLMRQFGVLTADVDAARLVLPPPPG
jgi:NitT/TauT family transport system substrate-binding protein